MTGQRRSESRHTRDFPYAGITIFVVFFGASVMDAISGARWTRVLFWTILGLAFLVLDHGLQPGKRQR